MQKFIATEPLDKAGEAGERVVWDAMQTAFARGECLGYWRYPIFSQQGKYRKEPDILIADRELGMIVVEVKSVTIEQIVRISGHLWEYQDYYAATGNPYQQAENQLFALLEYSDREPSLKQQVSGRALVALPRITAKEWQERGFDRLPANPPILFADCFSTPSPGASMTGASMTGASIAPLLSALRDRIEQTPPLVTGKPLTAEQWTLLLAVLAGTPLYRQPSRRVLTSSHSRGNILQQARDRLAQLDLEQERIAKQIPPGPQRIRGIAGSGKTVLLCQKAAHIHLKYPDWNVALVFFSRSLYHPILEQIDKWLRYFSNNEVGYDPKNRNLRVLHAWGAKRQPGLYSLLCRQAGVKPLTPNHTQNKQPNEALAEACCHLLHSAAIPQIFDAILLDEGQDLVVDTCKFEGKQPFYWLAYQALRPADPAHPQQRRFIWTCDEAQSLESLSVPSVGDLLGEELGHLVAGTYSNGMNKSEVLYRCYRTPHPILIAAHAIGMGWLRPGGMLTGMKCSADWNAIGYEITHLNTPQSKIEIILNRPRERSPNPIPELWQESCIEFKVFPDRQQELTHLSRNIIHNLRYDGLRPSREILVIVLGSFFEARQLEIDVANFLIQQGIDIYIPSTTDYNIIQQNKDNYNPNCFWLEGAVTVSRIHRAKGHEADFVHIVGLDFIAANESNLQLRNQLLVALTRARGWASMSGIGMYAFYEEIHRVLNSSDISVATFNRQPKREIATTDVGELLHGYRLGDRNFRNLNLQNAELSEVDLQQSNLIGANLRGANLQYAQLDETKLIAADLEGANLTGASLRKAKLMGANLRNANLTDADLSWAVLSDADLKGATLRGANLSSAELTGTDLEMGEF